MVKKCSMDGKKAEAEKRPKVVPKQHGVSKVSVDKALGGLIGKGAKLRTGKKGK